MSFTEEKPQFAQEDREGEEQEEQREQEGQEVEREEGEELRTKESLDKRIALEQEIVNCWKRILEIDKMPQKTEKDREERERLVEKVGDLREQLKRIFEIEDDRDIA